MSEATDGIEIDPAAFLKRTCERLAATAGVDLEVSSILTTMLTSNAGPSIDVVTARQAFRELAVTRVVAGRTEATSK